MSVVAINTHSVSTRTKRSAHAPAIARNGRENMALPTSEIFARPDSDGIRWHVLRTKSRQEKAVARLLGSAGIDFVLPLVRRVSYCGHRKRVAAHPLFTGYLFLHGTVEDTYVATATKRVVQVIQVADQQGISYELLQIQRALEGRAELAMCPYLQVGRRVRVASGPFRGIEGIVEGRPKPSRLVLRVQALGRAISFEIDESLLEAAD